MPVIALRTAVFDTACNAMQTVVRHSLCLYTVHFGNIRYMCELVQ